MIKANELRIGNIVKRKKQVLKVLNTHWNKALLKGYKSGNMYFKFEEIDPIPITSELLIEMGFKRVTTNDYWFSKKVYDNVLSISTIGNVEIDSWDRSSISFGLICEYVHQVQNLYFSLFGEELVFSTEP